MKHLLMAGTSLFAIAVAGSEADATTFAYTGTVTTFTIPVSGTYVISATGAQGGSDASGYVGGRGAQVGADVTLTAGTVLQIAVGGMPTIAPGANGINGAGGGGGGSFVVDSTNNPLVIAGGGGGVGGRGYRNGIDANTGRAGLTASDSYSNPNVGGGSATGTLGQGGGVYSGAFSGAGGGGFRSNGASETFNGYTYYPGKFGGTKLVSPSPAGFGYTFAVNYATGGGGWSAGVAGGVILYSACVTGSGDYSTVGGFGGGGGGGCGSFGGGGGGGYSGGDGGVLGGGGGSYVAAGASNAIYRAGVGYGNGFITIDSVPVPEPGSAGLLTSALIGIGLLRRRDRSGSAVMPIIRSRP